MMFVWMALTSVNFWYLSGSVYCFDDNCWSLAFGVPAALMVVAVSESITKFRDSNYFKTRMHSSRMRSARSLTREVYLPGGRYLPRGVYLPRECTCLGVYHVTYPIMHLMLPACCLLTNWDPPTVQLLIYCWLIRWPARHAGIPHPPLWTEFLTHASENITLPNFVAGGNK